MKTLACHCFKILNDLAPTYFNIISNPCLPFHSPQATMAFFLFLEQARYLQSRHLLHLPLSPHEQPPARLAPSSCFRSQSIAYLNLSSFSMFSRETSHLPHSQVILLSYFFPST